MILVIDDDPAVRSALGLVLRKEGFDVAGMNHPKEALAWLEEQLPELIILDLNFSRKTTGEEGLVFLQQVIKVYPKIPVILITGWGTIDLAVAGMKAGAKDFIHKPWDNNHLINAVTTALDLTTIQEPSLSRTELNQQYDFSHLIGEDINFLKTLETIGRVAATDAPVLILGESGTGKELVAEAIHQNSKRKNKPFVKVNLGGIASTLFESEMFGHKKGAFTDAHFDRVGRFELADTGSIFLDEIGDLDLNSQVKLLRVLQDRTYEVLGSSKTQKTNVRIIAATNRNLEEMVVNDQFREDLFYRINLITLRLPSLKERPDDIKYLAKSFLQNIKKIYNRPNLRISRKALNWLKIQHFPGNIRQLKNLVERTVLISSSEILETEDFIAQYSTLQKTKSKALLPEVGSMTLEEIEIEMIKKALIYHNQSISKTARALGLTRSSLYRRLEKYNLIPEE